MRIRGFGTTRPKRAGEFRLHLVVLVVFAISAGALPPAARAAESLRRKPLDPAQRAALVTLMTAVDTAQRVGRADADAAFEHHVLKSRDHTAYVPFRLTLAAKDLKSAVMYVRAVSRRDGVATTEEHSRLREWVLRGGDIPSARPETVFIGPGEMPVGGPASSSSRRTTQAPAEASAVLALQQREYERQKAADEAAKTRAETTQRDPWLFPFEDYYLAEARSGSIERALALPPGEFDVYLAVIDRSRAKTAAPTIVRRTITVPDFWNDQLTLSSLMLVSAVNTLKSPIAAAEQVEHPYTLGQAEIVPVKTTAFTTHDVLWVVYQVCNYGAPDADLTAEYNFYTIGDGARRIFNRTAPQQFADGDLPPVSPWDTQAFVSQAVPLAPFPAGRYELEVIVRDRLTRSSASASIAFSVQ